MRVLVGYASRHGSTRGIAERIAARLGENGAGVEVRPLGQVPDAGGYDAFVLGSAVYFAAWIAEAAEFVRRNLDSLAGKPVWLFSVGPLGDQGGALAAATRQEPKEIAGFRAAVRPRDYHVFSGAIDRDQLSFKERLIFKGLGGRYGDFRDWEDVDAWAEGIARQLAPEPAAPALAAGPFSPHPTLPREGGGSMSA